MNPYPSTSDAMETDAAIAGPSTAGAGDARGQQAQAFESAWSMLSTARQLIDQGKPSLALQAVMAAMKSRGGENAVFHTLQRARELYRNKIHENAAADELASLFAECAIAEAQQPSNPNNPLVPQPPHPPDELLDAAANDSSILAMSGRKQIMLDAFADGSSFICLNCGGIVSNFRKDEHLAYWCGKH
ncbi:uncharacterized protein A4U43_UnF8240 [Asparagus officinalis]|uniref:C2HC zinc finger plants domain-containing protein n=1 Tax=Asparagus officinalis TaxID=4686 RepID=A0A1R3L5Z5_ASPOF|nr:uncharacterized protein LOC109827896 [Asparagus officinalis]ONK55041.1 uncharacterized protein A4U43_UnF8240 [Asparagus officinalis]